jgi:lysophospholipase L1-like esterase
VAEVALRGVYFARNAMVQHVPLPYAFGDNYGPLPPWLDPLQILEDDRTLIWRSKAGVELTYLDVFSPVRREADRIQLLRRFRPSVPEEFRANPTWALRLNSEGYRGGEMFPARRPSTIRIACLGDSWTFGMPVSEDQTYPARLSSWLGELHSGAEAEYDVQNFGVLGYSSFQGLRLLRNRVLAAGPDVVVIGFGMNDSEVAGYRDQDIVRTAPPSITARLKDLPTKAAAHLETYKLLRYAALTASFRQRPIGEYLTAQADRHAQGNADYDALGEWTRVPPPDYESNVREMVRLIRAQGGEVVLLDNELWEDSPYRALLKKIAAEMHAPFVDGPRILGAARAEIERTLEASLDLVPDGRTAAPLASETGRTTVIFRVYRGAATVSRAMAIVGTGKELGALVPNVVHMHDDGTGGDQRAGDGVWSYAASLTPGERVFYVYTNSGAPGEWEGLDVPYIRRIDVPPAAGNRTFYAPVETFGRVYGQGDHWHPDAGGYDAIARHVADAIATLK